MRKKKEKWKQNDIETLYDYTRSISVRENFRSRYNNPLQLKAINLSLLVTAFSTQTFAFKLVSGPLHVFVIANDRLELQIFSNSMSPHIWFIFLPSNSAWEIAIKFTLSERRRTEDRVRNHVEKLSVYEHSYTNTCAYVYIEHEKRAIEYKISRYKYNNCCGHWLTAWTYTEF